MSELKENPSNTFDIVYKCDMCDHHEQFINEKSYVISKIHHLKTSHGIKLKLNKVVRNRLYVVVLRKDTKDKYTFAVRLSAGFKWVGFSLPAEYEYMMIDDEDLFRKLASSSYELQRFQKYVDRQLAIPAQDISYEFEMVVDH